MKAGWLGRAIERGLRRGVRSYRAAQAGQMVEVHSRSRKEEKVSKDHREKKKPTLSKAVGPNLKALRARAGLSQEQLATKARLTVSYISMLERGTRSAPLDTLERLAIALRVEPERLLRR